MSLHPRLQPFRDARLFLIALEGEPNGEEDRYFRALQEAGLIDRFRVHLRLLPTSKENHRSAPEAVWARLRDELPKEREKLWEGWVVIDVDTWSEQTLAKIAAEISRRDGCNLAVSNPCFELWLLLHEEVAQKPSLEDMLNELCQAERRRRSRLLKKNLGRLRSTRHGCAITPNTEALDRAIRRAQALDKDPSQRWPECPGTAIYRLIATLRRP